MKGFIRAYRVDEQVADDGPIPFVASTEDVARDGLRIAADGWQLANYRKNPIFLWAHDYLGQRPPIGRTKVSVEDGKLKTEVTFDRADPFAADIERKYREGFLNAVSVGWDTLEIDGEAPTDEWAKFFPPRGATITKAELLDISAVPVPGDPKALKERMTRGLLDVAGLSSLTVDPEILADAVRALIRGAIPANTGETKADEDADWDGPGEVAKCPAEREPLRRMHAWVDPDGEPDAKSSYKFPHHRADGTLVFKGCVAALGRLDQADIPDADKDGVRRHLEAHYREFDKEPPERSVVDAEVIWPGTALMMARLYLDMTDDADDDERLRRYRRYERRYRTLGKEPPEFLPRARLCLLDDETIRGLFLANEAELLGWQDGIHEGRGQRAGAVLSKRNRADLEQAIALVRGVLDRAAKEQSEEAERTFLTHLLPVTTDDGADAFLTALMG